MTDVDGWLDGAERLHRSVRVYQRGDLLAQLDELERQATIAASAGDRDDADRLNTEWDNLALQVRDSALTLTVRGLSQSEMDTIVAQADLDGCDQNGQGARLLAAAITEPAMTVDQVIRLHDVVGEGQFALVNAAYVAACRGGMPDHVVDGRAAEPVE